MKNLKRILMIALMTGMVAMNAEAKRSAPKDVAPLTKDGIVYAFAGVGNTDQVLSLANALK